MTPAITATSTNSLLFIAISCFCRFPHPYPIVTIRKIELLWEGEVDDSEVAESCVTVNPFSHPCLDKYDSGGVDQLKARIEATAPKVAAVLQGIHARSPSARIYVLNYPAIFPETGLGCWPQMPIGFSDVSYLRSTEQRLNNMLATQAAANALLAAVK